MLLLPMANYMTRNPSEFRPSGVLNQQKDLKTYKVQVARVKMGQGSSLQEGEWIKSMKTCSTWQTEFGKFWSHQDEAHCGLSRTTFDTRSWSGNLCALAQGHWPHQKVCRGNPASIGGVLSH